MITAGSTATSNLLYDGVDLVAEYDAANVLQRRYVHGPGVDEPLVVYEGATTAATAKSWLYADHLGSIIGTANATGTSTAVYSYGPYGEPNTLTGQRFRYTGQQLIKELGLYYYKARFYSPALGRFLQTDPIGMADDLNLYAYVGGNPVNRIDPTGFTSQEAALLSGRLAMGPLAGGVISDAAATTSAGLLGQIVGSQGSQNGGYDVRKDIYTPPALGLADKMAAEIEGITGRDLGPSGEVYSLRASREGEYPSVRGGTVKLQAGDVYKFGETTQPGERYSASDLRRQGLEYQTEFKGSQGMAKIVEKMRIYGYVFENGALPPGNRIFR